MINLSFLKGKIVGVVGLGKTGQATISALKDSNIKYKTYDDKENPDKDFLNDLDLIVWSPGIDVNTHEVAKQAKQQNIKIVCDIQLLYQACPDALFIGITGTNGKSTTVSLIDFILKQNGVESELGGNIGNPALSLRPLDKNGVYTIELSSYQLELIENMKFAAGGILNLSNDHLERHKNMQNYMDIKFKLLEKSKIKVISVDDEYCKNQAEKMKDKITVSVVGNDANVKVVNNRLLDFDLNIMQVDNLPYLKGKHNQQNIAFAYTILRTATKLSVDDIILGILRFKGLKHRQQLVKTEKGVLYINDSKATNCDAASVALEAYENVFWIVGGQSKAGGFDSLSKYLPKIKKAYIIGECEQELVEFFNKYNFDKFEVCKTLEKAVEKSRQEASKGDNVLLSPACASWDQFTSFEHRGDEFIKFVN
jgi:UDP-N-acetylmuramoylalanine--D-glutamate ligase